METQQCVQEWFRFNVGHEGLLTCYENFAIHAHLRVESFLCLTEPTMNFGRAQSVWIRSQRGISYQCKARQALTFLHDLHLALYMLRLIRSDYPRLQEHPKNENRRSMYCSVWRVQTAELPRLVTSNKEYILIVEEASLERRLQSIHSLGLRDILHF